jgi:type I restriction enzyme S subunit
MNTHLSQTNQQINSVVPNPEYGGFFSFFTLRELGVSIRSEGSGGSVFSNLSKSRFERLPLVLPPSELASEFNAGVSELMRRIELNQQQIATLAALRDTLLPRLISGKLRVPEAEKLVEAVL